jgi:hypothetical protein
MRHNRAAIPLTIRLPWTETRRDEQTLSSQKPPNETTRWYS